jgi:nicotinamide riboside kinase
MKIAFIGARDSGKTVLARQLANTLSLLGFNADHVVEAVRSYLRHYVFPYDRKPDLLDQIMIYEGQRERERELSDCEILVCDSATPICYVFTLFRNPDLQNKRDRMIVDRLWHGMLDDLSTYDLFFYLPPIVKDRKANGDNRDRYDEMLKAALTLFDIPHHKVEAEDLREREDFVLAKMAELKPEIAQKLAEFGRSLPCSV